jgi:hypothetical protein
MARVVGVQRADEDDIEALLYALGASGAMVRAAAEDEYAAAALLGRATNRIGERIAQRELGIGADSRHHAVVGRIEQLLDDLYAPDAEDPLAQRDGDVPALDAEARRLAVDVFHLADGRTVGSPREFDPDRMPSLQLFDWLDELDDRIPEPATTPSLSARLRDRVRTALHLDRGMSDRVSDRYGATRAFEARAAQETDHAAQALLFDAGEMAAKRLDGQSRDDALDAIDAAIATAAGRDNLGIDAPFSAVETPTVAGAVHDATRAEKPIVGQHAVAARDAADSISHSEAVFDRDKRAVAALRSSLDSAVTAIAIEPANGLARQQTPSSASNRSGAQRDGR